MIRHCERGHERACTYGDVSFFLGILTPLVLLRETSVGMRVAVVAGDVAWLVSVIYVRRRAGEHRTGKIGKLRAIEYYYAGLSNFIISALLSLLMAWYVGRH